MQEHTLNCRISNGDYAVARIDADGDVRLEVHMGENTSAHLYARPEQFAAFARAVLAETGESAGAPADEEVGVGDYVEITKYRLGDHRYNGKRGRVTSIDSDDIPYYVELEDGSAAWAREVRKVDAPVNPTRADLVERARAALAGTNPTAADIIRLAEFLAG